MTKNLKPFNLEEALAGKPVVTRDGNAVRYSGTIKNKTSGNFYIWIATEYTEESEPSEYLITTRADGICFEFDGKIKCQSDSEDLFMAPEKKTVWVNIWKTSSDNIYADNIVYDTEEEAKQHNRHIMIDSYPIEIEI